MADQATSGQGYALASQVVGRYVAALLLGDVPAAIAYGVVLELADRLHRRAEVQRAMLARLRDYGGGAD